VEHISHCGTGVIFTAMDCRGSLIDLLPVLRMVRNADPVEPPNAKVSYTSWRRIAVGTQDVTKVHDPLLIAIFCTCRSSQLFYRSYPVTVIGVYTRSEEVQNCPPSHICLAPFFAHRGHRWSIKSSSFVLARTWHCIGPGMFPRPLSLQI
jgi:hypothetical protein